MIPAHVEGSIILKYSAASPVYTTLFYRLGNSSSRAVSSGRQSRFLGLPVAAGAVFENRRKLGPPRLAAFRGSPKAQPKMEGPLVGLALQETGVFRELAK